MSMIRMRLQFTKIGAIRYTSHLDTMRMFQRGFKAGGLPVSYTQGFHPHPRMSFGPPLKTGWEGLDEYFDCYFTEPVSGLVAEGNRHLPEGLRLTGCAEIPLDLKKLPVSVTAARFSLAVALPDIDSPSGAIAPSAVEPLRLFDDGRRAIPPGEPLLLDMALSEEDRVLVIEYTCTMTEGKYLSPEKVTRNLLAGSCPDTVPARVTRTNLFVKINNAYVSPLQEAESSSRGNLLHENTKN